MNKEEIINYVKSFKYGGMSQEELSLLYDLCIDRKVLELGSFLGMSSYVIANVSSSLSCVDVWSDDQDHLSHDPKQAEVYKSFLSDTPNMFESFNKNCKEYIDSGQIKIYRGNTKDMADKFEDYSFETILFDADHSYEGVSSDFQLYQNKLIPHGHFLFHDYNDGMWTGIRKLCDELVVQGKIKFIKSIGRLGVFTT